jgi:3-methyladenine DNA glycosylase AlkD
MNKREATAVSQECLARATKGSPDAALKTLHPLLSQKLPFPLLDHAGNILGNLARERPQGLLSILDKIEMTKAMGGYVIIGSALARFTTYDLHKALDKAKEYIIRGNTWYVTDIIGERVPGKALVDHFEETLPILKAYYTEPNLWVKRSVGVAVHYFAKRIRDDREKANSLLELLSPYFEEEDTRVVKGIGWGLKTLGRYYPDLVVDFLKSQNGKKPSKLLLRKATTYLPPDKKEEINVL